MLVYVCHGCFDYFLGDKIMADIINISKKSAPPFYEIEFKDMDHTLTWLLETAEQYECREAMLYLEAARKCIKDKLRALSLVQKNPL